LVTLSATRLVDIVNPLTCTGKRVLPYRGKG